MVGLIVSRGPDLWRSLGRVVVALPRRLDDDMRGSGVSMAEFAVLRNLLEAPDHRLRMTDVASTTGFSPSRTTRIVDELDRRHLTRREKDAHDARGAMGVLTDEGSSATQAAFERFLAYAHRRVFDHVPADVVAPLARILADIAENARTR